MIWSNNDLERKKFTRVKICQKKRRRADGIIWSETTIHCDDDIEEVKLWQRFQLVLDWKMNQRLHQPSLFPCSHTSLIIGDCHCYPRPGHCHHVIRVLSERGEENQRGQAPDDDTRHSWFNQAEAKGPVQDSREDSSNHDLIQSDTLCKRREKN